MLARMMRPYDDLPLSVTNHHPSLEEELIKVTVALCELTLLTSGMLMLSMSNVWGSAAET